MEQLADSFLNRDVLALYAPMLLRGLTMTVLLSLLAIPIGLAAGLGVALVATTDGRVPRHAAIAYVDLFRAFPPLVLLILIHYALPFFAIRPPAILSVAVTLLLNTSSYYAEIFRAGLLAVARGQMEAARATGLGRVQALRYVVLPQAIRSVLPDLLGNSLEVVKLTAIASVVTFEELTHMARVAQGLSFNGTPLVAAAVIYAAMLWPIVRLVSRFERRALLGARR